MGQKPAKHLLVKDWKEGVVYEVQIPRMRSIPSASPFALKLETFLKFSGLPYKNVSNEFKYGSSKNQIPYIELNGRQHADSGAIIRFLISEFKLPIDARLSPQEVAAHRAYTYMVEKSLTDANKYLNLENIGWFFSDDKGGAGNFSGVTKFAASKFGPMAIKSGMKKALDISGMGRNSRDEVIEIVKSDLRALNTLLDGRKYFGGDQPCSFDATVFGILSQMFYTPQIDQTIINYITTEVPDIRALLESIKAEYWPEWDEVSQNLLMNSKAADEKYAQLTIPVHETAPNKNEI